jgi:hypothetical protein
VCDRTSPHLLLLLLIGFKKMQLPVNVRVHDIEHWDVVEVDELFGIIVRLPRVTVSLCRWTYLISDAGFAATPGRTFDRTLGIKKNIMPFYSKIIFHTHTHTHTHARTHTRTQARI